MPCRAAKRHKQRVSGTEEEGGKWSVVQHGSSFMTMWNKKHVWSLNACCCCCLHGYATQTCVLKHAGTHPPTQYPPISARTWVTQMCFPHISPVGSPSVSENKRGQGRRAEGIVENTKGDEASCILYLQSKGVYVRVREEYVRKRGWSLSLRCKSNNVLFHPSTLYNERLYKWTFEAIFHISCITKL